MRLVGGNRHWDLGENFRPPPGRGLDRQLSADQSQPLAHSDEPDPRVCSLEFNIKTRASVHDLQANFTPRLTNFDLCRPGQTVLNHIAQRFLGNSEETQRHVLWDFRSNSAVDELHLNPVLLAKLQHVGLVPALMGLCEEIGEKYG